MFAPLSESVALSREGLEGLCVSLNRPLVELESLPPGPARAAIALHRSASGERRLLLAVRSVDSGAVAFFAFAGRLSASPHKAMDTGLSLAERLGFLFDDDMLQATTISGPAAGAQRALECWYELLGEELPQDSELAAGSDPDDILDVEGSVTDLGKTTGKDAAAGKPTYPALHGVAQSRALARITPTAVNWATAPPVMRTPAPMHWWRSTATISR